jgi:hypothetical protein
VNLASLSLLGLICSKHIYTSDVYFNFNLLTKSQIGTSYYNIKHPVLSTVILIFLSLKSTKYDDFVLQRRVFNDCNGKLDPADRRQRLRSFVIVVKKTGKALPVTRATEKRPARISRTGLTFNLRPRQAREQA